jgi:hypothetical protein
MEGDKKGRFKRKKRPEGRYTHKEIELILRKPNN